MMLTDGDLINQYLLIVKRVVSIKGLPKHLVLHGTNCWFRVVSNFFSKIQLVRMVLSVVKGWCPNTFLKYG